MTGGEEPSGDAAVAAVGPAGTRTGAAGARVDAVVRRGDGFVLDLHLDLPAGRTTALVGPNGAGKSTAVAVLAGLVPVDDGRVTLDGHVVDDARASVFVPAPDRRVGVVFQHGALFGHLSVLDNVAFGPRSRGATRRAAGDVARRWLATLGVEELATRRPRDLSGGQAQRVALARALASEPSLLLLDEPMSALDVAGRAALRRVLATHLDGLAVPRLLVTHDPVEAFLLADRVAVLEDGRITQVGTPDEIRQRPGSTYAAELVGTNLLRGEAAAGVVRVGAHELRVADATVVGAALVTLHPHAIALSRHRPDGSQRNVWRAPVERVERLGDRCRVSVAGPLAVTAEVTPAAVEELGLAPGVEAWLAVKATEIVLTPDR